jgi:CRP-like cAMP-binding protein
MADQFIVQYVGFTSGTLVREYVFVVRDESGQSHEYTVTIANQAFLSHQVRYQDGPSICSRRLRRELAANATDPSTMQFRITDLELADYSNSSPKTANYLRKQAHD